MKNTIAALLMVLTVLPMEAQSIDLQSISSSGGQLTSTSGIALSSTIGEIATERLEESNLRLTQGFYQLFKIISNSNEVEGTYEIIVYPNPTFDKLTLRTEGADNELMVHIYNSSGQRVIFSKFIKKTLTIPFSDYPAGQYYAIIMDEEGKVVDQIPFQKINS